MIKTSFIKTKIDTSTGFLPCISISELRANALNISNAIVLAFINNSFQVYRWDSISVLSDDGNNTIAVTNIQTGRWRKCNLGSITQATTSVTGISRYATPDEVNNGSNVDASVKPYDLKQLLLNYVTTSSIAQTLLNYAQTNQLISVGKRYYDVKAIRTVGTSYPNPSATSPMVVAVCLSPPVTGTIRIIVTNAFNETALIYGSNADAFSDTGVNFIVPPGGTYTVTVTNNTSATKVAWYEER